MSKEDIDLEEDFLTDEIDDSDNTEVEVAKTNLAKRRIIDNILEERRLNKQIADFDFDF